MDKAHAGGIGLDVSRYQNPEQTGEQSGRRSVFFLPEVNSPYGTYYHGTRAAEGYGGDQRVEGRVTVKNPLIVKAGTGGKAPEKAYDLLKGKGAYAAMRADMFKTAVPSGWYRPADEAQKIAGVAAFLEKYGGDPSMAHHIPTRARAATCCPARAPGACGRARAAGGQLRLSAEPLEGRREAPAARALPRRHDALPERPGQGWTLKARWADEPDLEAEPPAWILREFDPSQPRDELGWWTDRGAANVGALGVHADAHTHVHSDQGTVAGLLEPQGKQVVELEKEIIKRNRGVRGGNGKERLHVIDPRGKVFFSADQVGSQAQVQVLGPALDSMRRVGGLVITHNHPDIREVVDEPQLAHEKGAVSIHAQVINEDLGKTRRSQSHHAA